MLIIDANTNAVIAETNDPQYVAPSDYFAVEETPADFLFAEANEWFWNGTAIVHDLSVRLARIKAQRLSELAALRYQHETAGITLSGMTIETDRQSQALITGAWSFAQLNPAVLIDWKAETGWIQIDAATISAIAGAVATHVQACFSNERLHAEAIAALETSEAVNEYDMTTDWPA